MEIQWCSKSAEVDVATYHRLFSYGRSRCVHVLQTRRAYPVRWRMLRSQPSGAKLIEAVLPLTLWVMLIGLYLQLADEGYELDLDEEDDDLHLIPPKPMHDRCVCCSATRYGCSIQ